MRGKANPTMIGLFVLGAMVLAVAGVIVFGSGRLFTQVQRYVLYFSGSVKGLSVGAPVKLLGVQVGSVKEIRLLGDLQSLKVQVPVVIEATRGRIEELGGRRLGVEQAEGRSEDIEELLVHRGLRARLELQSMVTGQLYVEFGFYPETPIEYHDREGKYRELPTVPSAMQELFGKIERIPIEQIAQDAAKTLDALKQVLSSDEVSEAIHEARRALEEYRKLGESLNGKVDGLVAKVEETLEAAKGTLKSGDTAILDLDAKAAPAIQNIGTAASSLTDTLKTIDEVMTNLKQSTAEGSVLRAEAVAAFRELSRASRALRLLAETIEREPEALLRGKKSSGGDR